MKAGALNSIRHRVLFALVCAGLLPSAALLLVTNNINRRVIEDAQYEKLDSVGSEVRRQVVASMADAALGLQTLRTNPLIVRPDVSQDDRLAEMTRIVDEDPRFTDLSLYDEDGWLLNSTTANTPEVREHSAWFFEARDTGEVVTSQPHRLTGIPGLHLRVFIPILIQDLPGTCVLKARLPFDGVWQRIEGAKVGEQGKFVLLDSMGKVLFYPGEQVGADMGRALDVFDSSRTFGEWIANPKGGYSQGGDGEDCIYVAKLIPSGETQVREPWVLLALLPLSEVNAAVHKSQIYQLIIGVATILMAGLGGLLLANWLAGPVVNASRAARRVAGGELDVRMPVAGAAEMQQLATSFNTMVDEVRNHRYHLEAQVASRTEKLRESQKQLEYTFAQLRAAYEAAQEGILVVAANGEIIAANERILDYFGIDGNVETMDSDAFRLQARERFEDPGAFDEAWRKVGGSGCDIAEGEFVLSSPKERVLKVYSAPVESAGGAVIARLWTFQDVSEQRTLQRSLEQAQKMEAVGRLAGGVAHDFNNVLTGIIGNLSLVDLGDGAQTLESQAEYLDKAKRAGQRAAELIKQLLGFSRRSHLELEYCDVNEVLSEVDGLLRSTIDPRIEIKVEPSSDLWSVEVDPTQVEQVVMNLCVNARDAMEGGSGSITLRTSNVSIGEREVAAEHPAGHVGDFVLLSVVDDGAGIPEEVMEKIFDPFFTTKEQGKGTGLGLATCYGIVEQHGGWIECKSEVGVGTSFHIYLPRKDRPEQESRPSEVIPVQEPSRGGDETVLLVDDEELVRSVAEGTLKKAGYSVLLAGDGEEALEIFAKRADEISLVMLDLTMPKMSGHETLAALREGYGDVPIIVCSGYLVDLAGFEEETGYRPDAAIPKPYDLVELVRKVREVIDGSLLALGN